MTMQVCDLIATLQKQPMDKEIEFVVVDTDGVVLAIDIEIATDTMVKVLQLFDR